MRTAARSGHVHRAQALDGTFPASKVGGTPTAKYGLEVAAR
jgi:hypothetical protein